MEKRRWHMPKFGIFKGYDRNAKLFGLEAMLTNSSVTLTTGMFLTGVLVMLGLDDLTIGMVASSGTWSFMLSILASYVVTRVRNRKLLQAMVMLAYRTLTCLPVFLLPLFTHQVLPAMTAAVMIISANLITSIFNVGYSIFYMDNLPKKNTTAYIYERMMWMRISFCTVSLIMGLVLDRMNRSYGGFLLVFIVAFVLGIMDVICIMKMEDRAQAEAPAEKPRLRLMAPLKDKRYLVFLTFIFVYFLFLNMCTSYISLYQVKYLELSYATLSLYNTSVYVLMIIMTRVWSKLEYRLGRMKMLTICAIGMALEYTLFGLVTKETLFFMFLSPFAVGMGASGFWTCLLPYRYDLMPKADKVSYEGWYGMIYGMAGLLGAAIAGKLEPLLPTVRLSSFAITPYQWIYLGASLLCCLTALGFFAVNRRMEHGDEMKKKA
ncbi:MAG: MFS transporter [Eubacteriales bacterium]|nr:MFS transporter [Eubacteriales bacterium]